MRPGGTTCHGRSRPNRSPRTADLYSSIHWRTCTVCHLRLHDFGTDHDLVHGLVRRRAEAFRTRLAQTRGSDSRTQPRRSRTSMRKFISYRSNKSLLKWVLQ